MRNQSLEPNWTIESNPFDYMNVFVCLFAFIHSYLYIYINIYHLKNITDALYTVHILLVVPLLIKLSRQAFPTLWLRYVEIFASLC